MEDTKTELFAILRTIKEQEKAVQEAIFKLEKAAAETERQVTYGLIQRVERDCVAPIQSVVSEFRSMSFAYLGFWILFSLAVGGVLGAEYMAHRADQPCQATSDKLDQWIDELRKTSEGAQKRKK